MDTFATSASPRFAMRPRASASAVACAALPVSVSVSPSASGDEGPFRPFLDTRGWRSGNGPRLEHRTSSPSPLSLRPSTRISDTVIVLGHRFSACARSITRPARSDAIARRSESSRPVSRHPSGSNIPGLPPDADTPYIGSPYIGLGVNANDVCTPTLLGVRLRPRTTHSSHSPADLARMSRAIFGFAPRLEIIADSGSLARSATVASGPSAARIFAASAPPQPGSLCAGADASRWAMSSRETITRRPSGFAAAAASFARSLLCATPTDTTIPKRAFTTSLMTSAHRAPSTRRSEPVGNCT
mmetsp:Transcript_8496/g.34753  ORF Transcript_8496/g.34753 Transcript_8496/m.34753 type:complete len:301 (-) Transcript_8496:982-1884(-)